MKTICLWFFFASFNLSFAIDRSPFYSSEDFNQHPKLKLASVQSLVSKTPKSTYYICVADDAWSNQYRAWSYNAVTAQDLAMSYCYSSSNSCHARGCQSFW